ncbi:MAG: SH3 domain-containing protein [bacterium]
MSYIRVLSIISTGVFFLFAGSLGGYYWASQGSSNEPRVQRSKETVSPSSSNASTSDLDNGTDSSDTNQLSPDNWEAFLEYDGERRRMLGVKKNYDGVNFRTGPSTTHSIQKTPGGGTLLMPIDRITNWFRARTRNGNIGWIHKSVIRELEVPKPIFDRFQKDLPSLKESTKKLIPEDFQKHNRVKVLESKVNLRQGPGTQFATAGRVYKYEELRLMGKDGDWFRVKTVNGTLGWVSSELVEVIWKTPVEEQKPVKITVSDPRMSPEFQFNQPKKLDTPLKASLLEIQHPWVLVKIDETTIGWVHNKELTESIQSLTE